MVTSFYRRDKSDDDSKEVTNLTWRTLNYLRDLAQWDKRWNVDAAGNTVCCDDEGELRRVLRKTPASLISVRRRAVPVLFPSELVECLGGLPFDLLNVVATPEVVAKLGVPAPLLGECLVFAGDQLLGRLNDHDATDAGRILGLLSAGVWPGLLDPAAEDWDLDDPLDPVAAAWAGAEQSSGDVFADVGEAWQRRLCDYHPQRFAPRAPAFGDAAWERLQLDAAFARLRIKGR